GIVRAEPTRAIITYSYVTDAGKKISRPTPEHPATYVLVSGGYRQEGEKVENEKTIPPEKVEQMVRSALAADNYYGATSKALGVFNGTPTHSFPANYDPTNDSKELDCILVYYWGYMNPEVADFGGDNFGGGSGGLDSINAGKIIF